MQIQYKPQEELQDGKALVLIHQKLEQGKLLGYVYQARIEKGIPLNHVVTISGRSWNEQNQTCDFLIRNSADEDHPNSYVPEKTVQKKIVNLFYVQ